MNTEKPISTSDTLICETTATGIAKITLNRPQIRNAFDDHLIKQLTDAFICAEKDPSVVLVLLSSTGKHFSAGADLNWMKSMANATYEENILDARQLAALMSTINTCSKPVVTKVQGAAFGGAIGLIACSDIVIAEENSSYALSEVKLGLSPATISPYVIDAIGARAARRLFLTGEIFNAEKAQKLGLISEIASQADLDKKTSDITSALLKNGPVALTKTKALIAKVSTENRNNALTEYTCELIAGLRVSDEGQEGLTAFLEKRPPQWPSIKNGTPLSATKNQSFKAE